MSYALHGAGLLDTPLASYDFYTWGEAGPGQWVTIYAKDSHAYMVVAGSATTPLRARAAARAGRRRPARRTATSRGIPPVCSRRPRWRLRCADSDARRAL